MRMAKTVDVYVPLSTDVVVKAYTNTPVMERVTVVPSGRPAMTFTGTGAGHTLIGQSHLTTPATSGDPLGYCLTVSMQSSQDGGATWSDEDVFTDSCWVQSYNLTVVVSEDVTSDGYNDASLFVSWPQQPGGGSDAG
jgi:hypothetical protein